MAASSQPAATLQPLNVEQITRQASGAQNSAEEQLPYNQSLLQSQNHTAPAQYLLTTTATTDHDYSPHQQHHQPNSISTGRLAAFQHTNAEVALTNALPSSTFARYALNQAPQLVQLELELGQQEQQPTQYAVESQLLAFAGQQQQENLVQQQQQVLQQHNYIPSTPLNATSGTYLTGGIDEPNLIQQQQQLSRNKLPETSQASSGQSAPPTGPQQIILITHSANQLNG